MLRRNFHQGCHFQFLRQLIGDFVDGLLSLYLPRLRSRPGIFSIGDRASMPKLPVQVAVFFRCAAHAPIYPVEPVLYTLKALWLLPRDI